MNMEKKNTSDSRYTGSYGGLLGKTIIFVLITVASAGIALPWAIVFLHRWVVGKSTVSKKQLVFVGHGKQLFPSWILVWLVGAASATSLALAWRATGGWEAYSVWEHTMPSLGLILSCIGAFVVIAFMVMWFGLKSTRILVANTHYEGGESTTSSFGSSYWQYIGKNIVFALRLAITIGIALPWALKHFMKWWTGETKIDDAPVEYTAPPSFLKKWIPYWLLIVVSGFAADLPLSAKECVRCQFDGHTAASAWFVVLDVALEVGEFLAQVLVNTFVLRQVVARVSSGVTGKN